MKRHVKIKDIAEMAGVSSGTVDRILHNRGNVSEASRAAVEKVLAETGYRYNIHASAISLKKTFRISVTIPTTVKGEYWESVKNGIEHAINEYSDVSLACEFSYYNQFDIYSCKSCFDSLLEQEPDAVILGATFISETRNLCKRLEQAGIPYIFIDSCIDGTSPAASYSTDQNACGRLIAKLLHKSCGNDAEFVVMSSERTGNESASNSIARRQGFHEYFERLGMGHLVKEAKFSALDPEQSEIAVLSFLKDNPSVKGIAVMNSRGYIIADILEKHGIRGIDIATFDLTANNKRCMKTGRISSVICQRPEIQGFEALKATIRILLYKQKEKRIHHLMPIDIVMIENLPYYHEMMEA